MARIHIDQPETYMFTTELQVRVSDINYGGHVGNDTILTFIHEARIHFYRHLGFKNEMHIDGDVGQILADAAVVYKSESFLGDVLEIKIAIADFNKYGFDMLYHISNKTTGREVARAKTGIVFFDYAKRKISSIPQILLTKLQAP